VPGPGPQLGARYRGRVQRHSTRERDGELNQDRAARACTPCLGRAGPRPRDAASRAVHYGERRHAVEQGRASMTDGATKPPSLLPFVVMCSGMFMALLDIQIVASSLQNIGGGLSAARDEISWVQTA